MSMKKIMLILICLLGVNFSAFAWNDWKGLQVGIHVTCNDSKEVTSVESTGHLYLDYEFSGTRFFTEVLLKDIGVVLVGDHVNLVFEEVFLNLGALDRNKISCVSSSADIELQTNIDIFLTETLDSECQATDPLIHLPFSRDYYHSAKGILTMTNQDEPEESPFHKLAFDMGYYAENFKTWLGCKLADSVATIDIR